VNNAVTEFSGTISDGTTPLSFDKAGTGTLILSGANTFTRAVNVAAGTLLMNGSNVSTANITVNGGTLGGTGSVASPIVVNAAGRLAPGASIESFAAPSASLVSGSTFVWEAANSSATGAYLLTLSGDLALTNVTLSLDAPTLAALAANTWSNNTKLTLINYGGTAITSGFASYNDDTLYSFGGNTWLFNYDDSTGGANYASEATSGNFITLTYVAAVPEPGAIALGFMAIAGGSCFALRRRSRS
jgi:autotransporter-associated beta strand protein